MRSKPYFGSRTALSDSPVCAPTSRKTFTAASRYRRVPLAEQRAGAEEDEGREDRKREPRIGKQAERVQHDDDERCEGDRGERPPAARPPDEQRDQPDHDPDDRAREPAGELVEAEQQLRVGAAVRQV